MWCQRSSGRRRWRAAAVTRAAAPDSSRGPAVLGRLVLDRAPAWWRRGGSSRSARVRWATGRISAATARFRISVRRSGPAAYGAAAYGSPPGYQPYGAFGSAYPKSSVAGWALGLSIAGLVLSCCGGILLSIPGTIMGWTQMKAVDCGQRDRCAGTAEAAFIVGIVGMSLFAASSAVGGLYHRARRVLCSEQQPPLRRPSVMNHHLT